MAENQPNMTPNEDIPYGAETPSGEAYKEVIENQNYEKVMTLALYQVLRDHEAEAKREQDVSFDEGSSDYVDSQARRTRLEQAIIVAYEEQRQNGLSEAEAADALLNNDTPSPGMLELLQERAVNIDNQLRYTDIGQEIHFLRESTPEVFETLTEDEQQSIHITVALEKLFREASGQTPLLDEWKEKLSDPSARKQLLSTGLKYGGYGLTAAALVSTFPVGTPAIIASKLISRNADFIASVASDYANKAAQTLVRSGLVAPETVDLAKDKFKQLDDKTKSNTFMRHGRKVLAFGAIALAASSLGIYSESMGLGDSANPEADASNPDASSDELALDSAEMMDNVGAMELEEQRVFMDSLHQLAEENGIDYQSMSSADVIDQLSAEQQQSLQGLVEPTAGAESAAPESPSTAENATPETSATPESAETTPDATRESEAPETAESDVPAAPESIEVTVEKSDTLSEILASELRAQGLPVDAGTLYGENGQPGLVDLVAEANPSIDDPDLIHAGETITIPSEVLSPGTDVTPEVEVVPAEPTPSMEPETPGNSEAPAGATNTNEHAAKPDTTPSSESDAQVASEPASETDSEAPTEPATNNPDADAGAGATVSEAASQDMMNNVGKLSLDEQRVFMESLHQVASEHSIDISDLKSHEIIGQLPEDQVASLQGLAVNALATSLSPAEAASAMINLPPETRYELVSEFRHLAEQSNIDFLNTSPEDAFDRLPTESKAQILSSLYSVDVSDAPELNEEALTASTQVGNDALEQQQTEKIASGTLGGWLSEKTQGAINWAKTAIAGGAAETGSAAGEGTETAAVEDSTREATTTAAALSMMAKKVSSREGYEKPEFPDVLDSASEGEQSPQKTATGPATPAGERAAPSTAEQEQKTKAPTRNATKSPGM